MPKLGKTNGIGRTGITQMIREKVWDRDVYDAAFLATQKVFSTGQIAVICNVAPRTVSKWFDTGRLKGYRLPAQSATGPGAGDRRVGRDDLIAFMTESGLPLGPLAGPVDVRPVGYLYHVFNPRVKELLAGNGVAVTDFADSLFDLAIGISRRVPDVLVIDTGVGRSNVLALLRKVRLTEDTLAPKPGVGQHGRQAVTKQHQCVVVVLTGDDDQDPKEYLAAGATLVRHQSFDPVAVTTEAMSALPF